jgi:hypothetical protein
MKKKKNFGDDDPVQPERPRENFVDDLFFFSTNFEDTHSWANGSERYRNRCCFFGSTVNRAAM